MSIIIIIKVTVVDYIRIGVNNFRKKFCVILKSIYIEPSFYTERIIVYK
jgi:hypothetical protein